MNRPLNDFFSFSAALIINTIIAANALAIDQTPVSSQAVSLFQEDKDGIIKDGEYEVMNENGSLTRRPCPYTCENRGIPREKCHEWKSASGDLCYVHDTRLPQAAVPLRKKESK
ncbi:MAG: hypothetical protein GYA55_11115 [SAR324 cluster bacterium]|uniref:Uncharacterized protein n=1 Tax=SAR324 cluster bacterium TaxID=2024889 RepID=A0A7X9FTM6_9DELT|nr:hypothetical protein [SAR324 cluster bacterium]